MSSDASSATIVRAVCPHDCPDTCSMLVTTVDGVATKVQGDPDHEFTKGHLCHKVSRYLDRTYHSDRLTQPMRRVGKKGVGELQPISWDDALDEITQRFAEIANGEFGPQAILPYSYGGTLGRIQGESLDRRFFHCLGASLLDRTICAAAGSTGYRHTIGSGRGMHPAMFEKSKLIINWGANPVVSNVHLWTGMVKAQKAGAKIITIDPFRSKTAERSDLHLAINVGADSALALGMMHVIFRDGLEDSDYLGQYCDGGDLLRERVLAEYSPSKVSEITGLSVETIEQLAVEYANSEAAAIRANYGLQRHFGGGMAMRTIACLPAVTGAWRNEAGGILLSTSSTYPFNYQRLGRPDLIPADTRTINMTQLAEALAGELPGPPIQAMYVYCSNPAAIAPDQKRVCSGLERDDLFTVVHEQFLTDTAKYADIVLPCTTQLEQFDLHASYGHHIVQVNQQAIEPVGESRCNTDVFRAMAARMGFDSTLFEVSDQDLAREALWEFDNETPEELAEITVDRLMNEGPLPLQIPKEVAPFANGKFPTPSGKCAIYSEALKKAGLDPLPTYIPPAESKASAPELARDYPLQLLSIPAPSFLNSTFANVPALQKSEVEPKLLIHANDAERRNISEGDEVRIFNGRGRFIASAVISDAVREGVVVAPGIWWNSMTKGNANANATTSSRLTDMGAGATFYDNLVEVAIADGDSTLG